MAVHLPEPEHFPGMKEHQDGGDDQGGQRGLGDIGQQRGEKQQGDDYRPGGDGTGYAGAGAAGKVDGRPGK